MKTLQIIKNLNNFIGREPLFVVSGRKTSFDVTEMVAGVEVNIDIKENTRGFEFGLSLARGGRGAMKSENEYLTTMFDAQEVAKGKLIKVWREFGKYKASIVLTDGTEQRLTNTRTQHFRELDRITSKDLINWAVDLAGSLTGLSN